MQSTVYDSPSPSFNNVWDVTVAESDASAVFDYCNTDGSEWKHHLYTHGYVVLTNVMTDVMGKQIKDQFQMDLRTMSNGRLDINDPATYTTANRPGVSSMGIFKDPASGFAHSSTAYMSRRATKTVFQDLFGVTHLQTSFDGGSCFPNWTVLPSTKTKGSWLHIDQGPSRVHEYSVQGMVNLLPANSKTGGLLVSPGTHNKHDQILPLVSRSMKSKANFLKLLPNNMSHRNIITEHGLKLVCAPAYSLILWDSRLVHCNTPAWYPPHRDTPCLRMAVYVCFQPADYTEKNRVRRIEFVRKCIQSNHWPIEGKGLIQSTMAFPRNKHLPLLKNCAIPVGEILNYYADML